MKELKEFTVERLEEIYRMATFAGGEELKALAKIALTAKQAQIVAWEVKGILCHTKEEASVYVGEPEPLYDAPPLSKPCIKCSGTGIADSGGTQPWGEPISIECDCTTPPLNHAEQDGWKLVPEEATIAMLTLLGVKGSLEFMQQKYKDMLEASPEPDGALISDGAKSDGWVKCSDQLPPDDDFVLIWPTPDFGVDLQVGQYMKYYKKGAGWFAQVNEQNYGIEWHPIAVTHWMKLPAAPKPEM